VVDEENGEKIEKAFETAREKAENPPKPKSSVKATIRIENRNQ